LIDETSVASYLASHGAFDGTRRVASDRITALEHEVAALRAAIGSAGPAPETLAQLQRERDDLRATVTTLRDALARMRSVAELQRQADVERAAMVEHLLAATAAGERADALRRSALQELEEAVAGTTQPAHPHELRP
jgi:uncharacterized protein involved in exopolysaccharide biosynthesis